MHSAVTIQGSSREQPARDRGRTDPAGWSAAGTGGALMHELSVATAIVQTVAGHAGQERVLSVRVRIGVLSGVLPDALQFCFPLATRGTTLDGADLVIDQTPARAECRSCGQEYLAISPVELCPRCGSIGPKLLSGLELVIESFEVN